VDINKLNIEEFLSTSENSICILDSELTVLYQNQKHKQTYGEHAGKSCYKAFHCRESQCVGCPAVLVFKDGKTHKAEKERIIDKKNRFFQASASPVFNGNDNPIAAVVRTVEITDQRERAEVEQDWLRTFKAIDEAITIHDADFNIIQANQTAKKLLGLPEVGTEKIKCYRAFHGLDEPPSFCASCNIANSNESVSYERYEPFLSMHLDVKAIPRYDKDNNFIGTIHIARNISERKETENELIHKEELLRRALKIAKMGSWEWDILTNDVRWTGEIYDIYGYDPKTFSPDYKTVTDAMHPDSLEPFLQAIDVALNRKAPFEMDYKLIHTNGDARIVHTKGEVVFDEYDKPVKMFGTVYDITERKRNEEEMTRLAVITEQAAEGIAVANLDGIITYANNAWASMHGYTPEEIIGKHLKTCHTEEQLKVEVVPFNERAKSRGSYGGEVGHKRKDGSTFPTYMTTTVLKDDNGAAFGIAGFATDITDLKLMENQLRDSLRQKEMLIREVNHRVKNNLALITSLLRLQGKGIEDSKAKQLFAESEGRVKAISMIHERLYKSTSVSSLNFGDYLRALAKNVFQAFAVNERVQLKLDIPDIISDVDTLIPCGLILNELLTNSLKYAFPDSIEGVVTVRFYESGNKYHMVVSDNGIGMSSSEEIGSINTMGLMIVDSLVKQINGDIKIENAGGTTVNIAFQKSTKNFD